MTGVYRYGTHLMLNHGNSTVITDMGNPNITHQRVMSLFPYVAERNPREKFNILWTSHKNSYGTNLFISSDTPANHQQLPDEYVLQVNDYTIPTFFVSNETIELTVTINPTRIATINGHKKRVTIPEHEYDLWFTQRLQKHGIQPDVKSIYNQHHAPIVVTKNNTNFMLASTTTTIHGTVQDPQKVVDLIHSGIGRGKTYGLGQPHMTRTKTRSQ